MQYSFPTQSPLLIFKLDLHLNSLLLLLRLRKQVHTLRKLGSLAIKESLNSLKKAITSQTKQIGIFLSPSILNQEKIILPGNVQVSDYLATAKLIQVLIVLILHLCIVHCKKIAFVLVLITLSNLLHRVFFCNLLYLFGRHRLELLILLAPFLTNLRNLLLNF